MTSKSITTPTSFINNSNDCASKPSLSSDSSIDSGCSAMTSSDSIHINQPTTIVPIANGALSIHERGSDVTRLNLSMLPPQPLVPPPPPPPQLQELYYEPSDSYDDRLSVNVQQPNQSDSTRGPNINSDKKTIYTENFYVAYAHGSQSKDDTNPNLPKKSHASIADNTNLNQKLLQQTLKSQRLSSSSLESASSVPLMPMNVKGMLLHGLPSDEVMRNWLSSLKCDDYIENFTYHGYDMHLVTKMTPQDLAAVGCKSPALRKKLLTEIKKLNLDYDIPDCHHSIKLEKWLETLKLNGYYETLISEGYHTVDDACKLTWEDLEEIGITKLGHQKRFLLGIEKMRKLAKQREESLNDNAIYDVHPNHRISLNGAQLDFKTGTLGRVRSGFFQTRSGANLDHRGLPMATVMPALKHVSSPIVPTESNIAFNDDRLRSNQTSTMTKNDNDTNVQTGRHSVDQNNIYGIETLKLNDINSNPCKKNSRPPPPLRTNSLKVFQDDKIITQPIYGTNHPPQSNTNSTSFLRTPKLGTLTATTNKMLTSGGHMQTISSTNKLNERIVPIREAPLPPTPQMQLKYQQNLTQMTIPEKIDEEQASSSLGHQPMTYPMPLNCDGTNPTFINMIGDQLADATEFPPPPPCQ